LSPGVAASGSFSPRAVSSVRPVLSVSITDTLAEGRVCVLARDGALGTTLCARARQAESLASPCGSVAYGIDGKTW